MAERLGLRERKKRETRQRVAATARRLFTERGFEHVSVAEIARAANVSEPTVFNHFPTKEDLVYAGLEQFESDLLTAVAERAAGESVVEAFGRFVLKPRGFFVVEDERAARELIALSRMIATSPALLAREQQIFTRNSEALAELLARETKAQPGDLRPAVVASALIGVHRALVGYVREQLGEEPVDRRRLARRVKRRGEAALVLVADGIGDYGRRLHD